MYQIGHVNRTNCVESRSEGGGGDEPIAPPAPLKASCNYTFFEVTRVKLNQYKQAQLISYHVYLFIYTFFSLSWET